MKPAEIRSLLRLRGVELDRVERQLGRSHTIDDLRREARRVLPHVVFDYVDGGADEEETLAANVSAWRALRLFPLTLTAVERPDPGVEFLGRRLPLPLGLSPTGYTRLMHADGELAVAAAAADAGLPYVMSTVASTGVDELGRVPGLDLWAQLYVMKDKARTWEFVERIGEAGVRTLEVSVDTTVSGFRTRDVRNGLAIPPELSPKALVDIGTHPSYWSRYLRAPAMTFPNLASGSGSIASFSELFDPALGWDTVAQLRERWPHRLLLKGPVGAAAAVQAVSAGLDGVHLSNHGGRQLDRCATSLDLLGDVRAAIGPEPIVVVDSGIRHGSDVVAAYALGADLAMVGRAYLYGLAVGGQPGVARAIEILDTQVRRTMHLLGVGTMGEVREHADELFRRTGGE